MSRLVPGDVQRATHVLAICDASPAALNAGWRAALVARDLRVPLHVVHATTDNRSTAPLPRVAAFLHEAAERCAVRIEAIPAQADPVEQCVPLARGGLVVLPTTHGNPLAEWLMGGPAERLIRLVRAPVLVVKQQARIGYRRVLVAVDLQQSSEHLVAQASVLARGPLASFHALAPGEEIALRELDAPPHVLRAHRRSAAARAYQKMKKLLPGAPVSPIVTFGGAADSILAGETAQQTELLVVGKRRRGLLADFLLGSVTRQVLARSEADVLVLPLPPTTGPAVVRAPRGPSLQG
jgi:nucleotide-binding universal stress UspA family protein